jgi:hypothetical protein
LAARVVRFLPKKLSFVANLRLIAGNVVHSSKARRLARLERLVGKKKLVHYTDYFFCMKKKDSASDAESFFLFLIS